MLVVLKAVLLVGLLAAWLVDWMAIGSAAESVALLVDESVERLGGLLVDVLAEMTAFALAVLSVAG